MQNFECDWMANAVLKYPSGIIIHPRLRDAIRLHIKEFDPLLYLENGRLKQIGIDVHGIDEAEAVENADLVLSATFNKFSLSWLEIVQIDLDTSQEEPPIELITQIPDFDENLATILKFPVPYLR